MIEAELLKEMGACPAAGRATYCTVLIGGETAWTPGDLAATVRALFAPG